MINTPVKYHDVLTTEAVYFQFEEDFMQDNIRCIPMIVRFKLDAAGIKLKLAEWSRFSVVERDHLSTRPCNSLPEIKAYRNYLYQLILMRTGNEPTNLVVDKNPEWANIAQVCPSLQMKAREHNWYITISQWRSLNDLQRFALLKLYRPGHESKNFPKAMKEFKLV